ncbi:MAG: NAD(P)-dependent alcohol dehydrogenase [Acidimicrobiia bacterium]|nr:NAD(P)-dependent alcohol dehydrogenase [Acidimicrobiia bacterium]
MQAIIHERFGPPSDVLTIEDVDTPQPGRGEVLVQVRATAVAKGDWLVAHGYPYIARPAYGIRTPKHRIAGLETSGVVEAVGADVTDFQKGDEVFGWTKAGSLAEFVAIPADHLVHKPGGITFEQAAAVPVSGFAALQAVRDAGGVDAGMDVLVIGASGGVGSFAVQIAKALGAEVTGVASTSNVGFVGELGADHVIDYTQESITGSGRRFDVIIDIAGNNSISTLRSALAGRGTAVIVGGSGGKVTMGFGRTLRSMLVSPFVPQRLKAVLSKPNQEDLKVLAGLVESGELIPRVEATYPLAQAAQAIELVGAGKSRGKTVVTI